MQDTKQKHNLDYFQIIKENLNSLISFFAKVEVEGSNPFARSIISHFSLKYILQCRKGASVTIKGCEWRRIRSLIVPFQPVNGNAKTNQKLPYLCQIVMC